MSTLQQKLKLPALTIAGSFLTLSVFMSLTDPFQNPFFSIVVFALMAILLISIGYFLTILRGREITPRRRIRIILVASLIMVGAMLRSFGSLDAWQTVVLLIVGAGLWFYTGRR